ncbi:hypothetical protein ACX93W_02010 [Paenibacillus sp. CAU 1782]
MKKTKYFIAGTLVGAVVMTAGSAIAAEVKQLVGTKVGSVWELHVDGKVVGEVPIINGNSYGPVRQIAEIAGMDVDFEPGKVFLETKEADGVGTVTEKDAEFIGMHIGLYERMISNLKQEKSDREAELTGLSSAAAVKEKKEAIEVLDAKIAEYEAEIAALEAELAEATK